MHISLSPVHLPIHVFLSLYSSFYPSLSIFVYRSIYLYLSIPVYLYHMVSFCLSLSVCCPSHQPRLSLTSSEKECERRYGVPLV